MVLLSRGSVLRGDIVYDSKTQLTGGSLYQAVLAVEPPGRGAKKPLIATYAIKGNRMSRITKDHMTIVNLDQDTIFEVDLIKKTYLQMNFAQMKELLDRAVPKKSSDANHDADNNASEQPVFQVSSKFTDRTKPLDALNAEERIVTAKLEGSGRPDGPSAAHDSGTDPRTVTNIFVESWMLTVPGFDEAQEFFRKLGEKLSYAYALGMFEIGSVQPELLPGFEELAKLLTQGEGMPVESTIRMGGPGAGDLAQSNDAASTQKGIVSGALSRLGSIRRKEPAVRPSAPGVLVEMTTELSNLNSGFAEESKFTVPNGFNQAQPPAPGATH
jgi:hypothetical protein